MDDASVAKRLTTTTPVLAIISSSFTGIDSHDCYSGIWAYDQLGRTLPYYPTATATAARCGYCSVAPTGCTPDALREHSRVIYGAIGWPSSLGPAPEMEGRLIGWLLGRRM